MLPDLQSGLARKMYPYVLILDDTPDDTAASGTRLDRCAVQPQHSYIGHIATYNLGSIAVGSVTTGYEAGPFDFTTPAGKYLVKSTNLVTTLPNQTLVCGVDENLQGRQSICALLLANGPTPACRQIEETASKI